MNSIRIMGLFFGFLLSVNVAKAAVLTIFNNGSNTVYVNPKWDHRCGGYDTIKSGESAQYNSGVYSIYEIKWVQKLPDTAIQLPGQTNMKIFKTGMDINAVTLGAEFKILNDGSYTYRWGFNSGSAAAEVIKDL